MSQAGLRLRTGNNRDFENRDASIKVRHNRGFSLLELVIVLLILGMVATQVPPVFNRGGSTLELKTTVKKLVSALYATRAQAVADNREARFDFNADQRQYTYPGGRKSLPLGIGLEFTGAQSESPGVKQGGVRFFPDGSNSGGRLVVFAVDDSGKHKQTIELNWLTGRIHVLSQ